MGVLPDPPSAPLPRLVDRKVLMNKLALSLLLLLAFIATSAHAAADSPLPQKQLDALASDDAGQIVEAARALSASGDERALPILAALESGKLVVDTQGGLFIVRDDGSSESVTSSTEKAPAGKTHALTLNNVSRRAVQEALAQLSLQAKNLGIRRAAARKLSEYPDDASVELMRTLVAKEQDREARDWMRLAIAKVDLTSPEPSKRISAAHAISESADISLEAKLRELVGSGQGTEKNPEVRAAMLDALRSVQGRAFWISVVSNTVYGLSLGSVLVLAALGLAITFGLMRVINMAHGEMLMLGAYSTFFVRELLVKSSPSMIEWYLLFAIPFAFFTTFVMGVLLERLVIKHLYGRPLETLLATWGLSLILIQVIRVTFGAQNVAVANPEWLSGGWEALPSLVIPYSRIAVLLFTGAVVGFVGFILRGTSMGLKVRAVTQNREIASSLGIPAQRIDMWTFGLGSGLAGLGGVALSQLGNVGPELGQQHIIDSFMVVVLGGVGNVLGTISAGVGLGIANKVLEPSFGAVLAKIILLGLLIAFIQWRPQGLFALKGRAAEN